MPRKFERLDAPSRHTEAELPNEAVLHSLDVPLIGVLVLRREFVERAAQDAAHIVFENQILLLDAFEQLAAQAINGLTLLVHHIVVFEQMFA